MVKSYFRKFNVFRYFSNFPLACHYQDLLKKLKSIFATFCPSERMLDIRPSLDPCSSILDSTIP